MGKLWANKKGAKLQKSVSSFVYCYLGRVITYHLYI